MASNFAPSSLDEKFNALGFASQKAIYDELTAKHGDLYSETFVFYVRWMVQQLWEQAVGSDGPSVVNAKTLMDALFQLLETRITQLNSQGNFQDIMNANNVQKVLDQLKERHEENPVELALIFVSMKGILKQCIDKETAPAPELSAASEAMDESSEPDPYDEIRKKLQLLETENQTNEQLVKELEALKEQYVITFHEVQSKIAILENYKTQVQKAQNLSETEKKKQVEQSQIQIEKLQQEVQAKGVELSVTKRNELIIRMGQHLNRLASSQDDITKEIEKWKLKQQKAMSGWPEPESLQTLQQLCEPQSELLWKISQQIIQLDNMFRATLAGNAMEQKRMENFTNTVKGLLNVFLNKAFIIEKQPPQVLKTQTRFAATVRHLIGGKLNAHFHPAEVTCTVVSEKQANLVANRSKGVPANKDAAVLNNKKAMEYNQKTNQFVVEFKNLSLTRANRQGGKNKETVAEEKSAVVFSAQFSLGKQTFSIMVMSLPVVITVHGNQHSDAAATILWDNVFSQKGRKLFEVPDEAPWPLLEEALKTRWSLDTKSELSEENLHYLGTKLLGKYSRTELEASVVSRATFNRDHLPGRTFTFWRWFYGALDLVKKHLKQEWQGGFIMGFVSKQEANNELMKKAPGTFLLRFSDSEVGGVTVANVVQNSKGEKEIWNLQPWTNAHLQMRKLADRVKDLNELMYLYPDRNKHDVFGTFYTDETETPKEHNPNEYKETLLATVVAGAPSRVPTQFPNGRGGNLAMSDEFLDAVMWFPTSPSSPPQSIASSFIEESNLGVAGEEVIAVDGSQVPEGFATFFSALNHPEQGPRSYQQTMATLTNTSGLHQEPLQ